jgi:hypothetical protein
VFPLLPKCRQQRVHKEWVASGDATAGGYERPFGFDAQVMTNQFRDGPGRQRSQGDESGRWLGDDAVDRAERRTGNSGQ